MSASQRKRWLERNLVKYRRVISAGCVFVAAFAAMSSLPFGAGDEQHLTRGNDSPERWLTTSSLGANLVAAPIRFGDSAAAALLREHDIIDVIAADGLGGSAVVASQIRVVSIPGPTSGDSLSRADAGSLVVLAVTSAEASELAGAAAVGPLSFVLHAAS